MVYSIGQPTSVRIPSDNYTYKETRTRKPVFMLIF